MRSGKSRFEFLLIQNLNLNMISNPQRKKSNKNKDEMNRRRGVVREGDSSNKHRQVGIPSKARKEGIPSKARKDSRKNIYVRTA